MIGKRHRPWTLDLTKQRMLSQAAFGTGSIIFFWLKDSWDDFFLQYSPELRLGLKKVQYSFLLAQLSARPWDWQVWKYELMLIRCTSGITTENSRGRDTPSHLKPAPDFLGCQTSLQQAEYLTTSDASEVWMWTELTAAALVCFTSKLHFPVLLKQHKNREQKKAVTLWWDDCNFREMWTGGMECKLGGKTRPVSLWNNGHQQDVQLVTSCWRFSSEIKSGNDAADCHKWFLMGQGAPQQGHG